MNFSSARAIVSASLAVALAACGAPAGPVPRAADALDPAATGWLRAEAPGEATVVYRERAGAPGLSLSCLQANHSFTVEAPNPGMASPRRGEKATLYLGAVSFEATVTGAGRDEAPTILLETEVIPQLLDALRRAHTVRFVYGPAAFKTDAEASTPLSELAARCERLVGDGDAPSN